MLTEDELKALNLALNAVYSLKYQAEDRASTHIWNPVIKTLEELIDKNKRI
jgi:hypothetical protein